MANREDADTPITTGNRQKYERIRQHNKQLWLRAGRFMLGGVNAAIMLYLFVGISILANDLSEKTSSGEVAPAPDPFEVGGISVDTSMMMLAVTTTLIIALNVTIGTVRGAAKTLVPIPFARKRILSDSAVVLASISSFIGAIHVLNALLNPPANIADTVVVAVLAWIIAIVAADATITINREAEVEAEYQKYLTQQEVSRLTKALTAWSLPPTADPLRTDGPSSGPLGVSVPQSRAAWLVFRDFASFVLAIFAYVLAFGFSITTPTQGHLITSLTEIVQIAFLTIYGSGTSVLMTYFILRNLVGRELVFVVIIGLILAFFLLINAAFACWIIFTPSIPESVRVWAASWILLISWGTASVLLVRSMRTKPSRVLPLWGLASARFLMHNSLTHQLNKLQESTSANGSVESTKTGWIKKAWRTPYRSIKKWYLSVSGFPNGNSDGSAPTDSSTGK